MDEERQEEKLNMSAVVGTEKLAQVGFLVKDIIAARKRWAEFLGLPEPPLVDIGDPEITKTEYMGKPSPNSKCVMAFFDVGPSLQIELIQPNEEHSTWRDCLDKNGEGIHHLAFNVTGMNTNEAIKHCEDFGMKVIQRGEYGSGDGRYTYLDAQEDLKCVIELLESDK